MPKPIWKKAPDEKDYAAALEYLSLVLPVPQCKTLIRAMRKAPATAHLAKDILRASRLPLLAREEVHVAAELKKIAKGKALAPVLLVRGDGFVDVPLIVADGYHRICAMCCADEDAPIPCRIVQHRGA